MLKKWLSGALTSLLCVSIFAGGVTPVQPVEAAVRSDVFTSGYLRCVNVDEDGDGEYDYVSVVKGIDDQIKGIISVPSIINDLPVKRIEEKAFYKCQTPRSILLGANVEYIGPYAFAECSSLEGIDNIGDLRNVKIIDKGAFMDCSKLVAYLYGPMSVFEYIGDYAFKNCAELKGAELADTLTYLGKGAFDGCAMLSTVTIPKTIKSINEETFRGTAVHQLTLPENISYIGKEAFAACNWLSDIEILNPDCSIYDDSRTICGNKSEEKYYSIPITGYAGSTAEQYCKKYDIPFYKIYEPITYENFTYDVKDCVIITDVNKDAETVVIPDEIENLPVQILDNNCLLGCKKLKKLVIGNNVVLNDSLNIPNMQDCVNLETIKFGKSTECIRGLAGLGALKNVDMSECDELRYIDDCAFYETAIESVELPEGVEYIGVEAFCNCKNLESVTLPDSIKCISSGAFKGTPLYNDQTGVKYAGNWVIGYNNDIESAEIKEGTIGIADYAFSLNDTLKEVVVPETVSQIGSGAFMDNKSLERITILNPDCIITMNESTICTSYKGYDGIIYGYENSTAQTYAENRGYRFESLGEKPWSASDAVKLQKFFVKSGSDVSARFDLNGDEKIDVFDMILLKRKLLSK